MIKICIKPLGLENELNLASIRIQKHNNNKKKMEINVAIKGLTTEIGVIKTGLSILQYICVCVYDGIF